MINIIREPAMLVTAFLLILTVIIIYVRLDFSLSTVFLSLLSPQYFVASLVAILWMIAERFLHCNRIRCQSCNNA